MHIAMLVQNEIRAQITPPSDMAIVKPATDAGIQEAATAISPKLDYLVQIAERNGWPRTLLIRAVARWLANQN
jgi:hypothetical protein